MVERLNTVGKYTDLKAATHHDDVSLGCQDGCGMIQARQPCLGTSGLEALTHRLIWTVDPAGSGIRDSVTRQELWFR